MGYAANPYTAPHKKKTCPNDTNSVDVAAKSCDFRCRNLTNHEGDVASAAFAFASS